MLPERQRGPTKMFGGERRTIGAYHQHRRAGRNDGRVHAHAKVAVGLAHERDGVPSLQRLKLLVRRIGRRPKRDRSDGRGASNVDRVVEHARGKRDILRAAGYTHVNGKGGRRIPLDEASDKRVGEVFRKTLAAYQRRAH